MAAKGCCDQNTCSCLITAGDGIAVSGSGTATDPYVITSALPDFSQLLTVQDTATINLALFGSGEPGDPFVLRGDATVAVGDLTNVSDPTPPVAGDVLIFSTTGTPHWEYGPPPVAPAGATNVAHGLSGIGSVPNPVIVETSGVWGVAPLNVFGADSTVGLPIYVDINGDLRASPVSSIAWTSITGKPTYFPVDPATTWDASNILNQQNLNAGRVNGVKITVQTAATPDPTVGNVVGDLLVEY